MIAYRWGSVPEVLDEGLADYIVDSLEDAVSAVEKVGDLDRGRCRDVFEQRFSVSRMARDYLAIYERQLEGQVVNMRRAS